MIWNIFDGFEGDARTRQAKNRARQYQANLEHVRDSLASQIEILTEQITTGREIVESQRERLSLQKERVETVEIMIRRGAATPDDLLEEQIRREQAELDLIRSIRGYVLKRSELADLISVTFDVADSFDDA